MIDSEREFGAWLTGELERRGWSRSEAARRGGVSASMFDKVINGHALAGPDFCNGVARAFRIAPETVFRLAGILPPLPPETAELAEAYRLFAQLPREQQELFLAQIRAVIELRHGLGYEMGQDRQTRSDADAVK